MVIYGDLYSEWEWVRMIYYDLYSDWEWFRLILVIYSDGELVIYCALVVIDVVKMVINGIYTGYIDIWWYMWVYKSYVLKIMKYSSSDFSGYNYSVDNVFII